MAEENIKQNFFAFIWHGFWLSLAQTFAERNTILPALILSVGGTEATLGALTSVVIGIPIVSQLVFASYLNPKPFKKKFLILGIELRVFAFAGLSFTVFTYNQFSSEIVIAIIFSLMLLFSISGAFAGVSYTDIVGKSMTTPTRKKFLVYRQFINGIGLLISAIVARQLLHQFDYPTNYQVLFGIAAILLFIASFGFFALKEKESSLKKKNQNLVTVLKSIPNILKENQSFRTFIIMVNLTGFAITIVPFYISFGKTTYPNLTENIGNLLLIQIVGQILSNIFWSNFVKSHGYKGIVRILIGIQFLLPILFIISTNFSFIFYSALFFIVGIGISAQRISFEGILYEVTSEENRALLSGVYGALSLSLALFPLIASIIISTLGYTGLLLIVSFVSLFSIKYLKRVEV